MSSKMIALLVAVGIVAFSMAFFRTGSPEISGLERPSVNLNKFASLDETGKAVGAPTSTRFKNDAKKPSPNRKTNKIRRKDIDEDSEKSGNRQVRKRDRDASRVGKVGGLRNRPSRVRGRNQEIEDRLGRGEEFEEEIMEDLPPAAALGIAGAELMGEQIEEEMDEAPSLDMLSPEDGE